MNVLRFTTAQISQKFVGGALSSLAGMQSFAKQATGDLSKFKGKANYLFGTENKIKSKALTYGFQSLATDFAYTDRAYFLKRNIGNHLLTFTLGMANGSIQYDVGKIERWDGFNIAERLVGYGFDYLGQTVNQGYNPFTYDKRNQKVGIFSLKSVVFNY